MLGYMKVLAVLSTCLGTLPGHVAMAGEKQNPITAIDIALEPDATMIQYAKTANARLRKDYPKGFAFDASHKPHITILQRYVHTADLNNVYAAAGKVLTSVRVDQWRLKAIEYYCAPWETLGLASIVVEPTDDLLKLQQKLIDVMAPFTVQTGTAAAFVTTPEEPNINQSTIDYVAAFVPEQTGKNFDPHVTIGIASKDYLKKMLAESFDVFTFSPAGVSVYQLGNFGTARKQLKAWN
jgi:2'-5' RNA ligase